VEKIKEDNAGKYFFANLTSRTYKIEQIVPSGNYSGWDDNF
jgi:hypothetical protein